MDGGAVRKLWAVMLWAAVEACLPFRSAQAEELDAQLNERILSVPVGTWPQEKLQVTFFKPEGKGPFPLAVLNHGKEKGFPKDAQRYRSAYAARYFLSRGYAVILPMLRGFAGSSGTPFIRNCEAEQEGLEQAADIAQVIRYMGTQSDVDARIDTSRVLVFGQSLGGWNTLAVGTLDIPGVKGLVNFSGGRNAPNCPGWQRDLAVVATHYGEHTHVPSLWFYGDNDALFPVPVWRGMYDGYSGAGAKVELVAYGNFMKDSHNFLGSVEALPMWTPKVDAFLARIGLPAQNIHPEYLPAPYPAATGFADIDDAAALPLVGDNGRRDYQAFLTRDMPRVFGIASTGTVVAANGGYDPMARALALCAKNGLRCQIYAVDDKVVWPKPVPVPTATHYAQEEDLSAVPYLNDRGREGYARFLTLPKPRAFVIAPDGAWSLSSRDFDVLDTALKSCSGRHSGCRAYAVNDDVVWAKLSP